MCTRSPFARAFRQTGEELERLAVAAESEIDLARGSLQQVPQLAGPAGQGGDRPADRLLGFMETPRAR